MKIILAIILSASIFISCNSQSKNITKEKSKISEDLNEWLTEGEHTADIMNSYNPRATELSEKMSKSIALNQEWYFDFVKTIPEGEKMPYHKNLGINKDEYNELMLLFENVEVFSSAQGSMNIIKKGNKVLFESNDTNLQALKFFTLDLVENTITFQVPNEGKMILTYKKKIVVDNNKNAYKSAWKGYQWTYESGIDNLEVDDIKNVSEIKDFIKFEFTLGVLNKNKKIILDMEMQSMSNGKVIANNKLPLLIE